MAEKGKKGKAALPARLKSDDVTGQYKEGDVVWFDDLPEQYRKGFNNAWNAVRNDKVKLFQTAVENLLTSAQGTAAEGAPLDVYCKKASITFDDPEKSFKLPMCLLAFCAFHCRLEMARMLIEKGANIDSGNSKVGSPLLQMMVLHTARGKRKPIQMNAVTLLVEENHSVLSRVITTDDAAADEPATFHNASVLNISLYMKNFDLAQYFFSEHNLHPIFCGSRDYPPLFLEYMEYGTFNFIPWLVADGYTTKDEIVQFTQEVIQPEVLSAARIEDAAKKSGRNVAHAMLLCANRRGLRWFRDKRPDLVSAVDTEGKTALFIAAEEGLQKPVNMLTNMCGDLIWVKNSRGTLPLLAGAKSGHTEVVERILQAMLNNGALSQEPKVCQEMEICGLAALQEGYMTYFEALHNSKYQVEVLNLSLDVLGNTATHIAAMKGKEDLFQSILPHSIPEMIAVLTAKNAAGKTPLQLAIDRGHASIFNCLQSKTTQWKEAWKVHNDTLLLYACVHGNVELVKSIMQLGSTPDVCSSKGRTPLSCAAEAGNVEIVCFLLSYRHIQSDGSILVTSPEGSGKDEWSPLMLAATNGHAKVCKHLLNKGAKVNRPRDPKTRFTPLMMAIYEGNRDVVITILSDKTQGMEAMKVCEAKPGGADQDLEITTPMRMLIEEMPDVAEWLMNRCINHRELDTDERGFPSSAEAAQNFVVEYNFQFLEDFNDVCSRFPGMRFFRKRESQQAAVYRQNVDPLSFDLTNGAQKIADAAQEEAETVVDATPTQPAPEVPGGALSAEDHMDVIFDAPSSPTERDAPVLLSEDTEEEGDEGGRTRGRKRDWRPTIYQAKYHTLNTMLENDRADLLKHPLVVRLIEYKWRSVAFPLFIAYISVYLVFVTLLTAFAVVSPRPGPESDVCLVETLTSDVDVMKTNGTCNDLSLSEDSYLYGSAVFMILLSLAYLAVEVVQMVRRKQQYFTEGENYIQVLTFVLTIIFVSGFGNECWCAPTWQWQIGALALFLAWFNLVILLKDMPFAGIPINMLFNICLTFVRLVFLPILLIIAFALPFYMLFVRNVDALEGSDSPGVLRSFFSPSRALAKTIMQTAGELDFETLFNEADLVYAPMAYLLFITFVVVMPILFSNLLVGLAVGDTADEINKATFTRTKLQVNFILELEGLSSFLRGHMRPRGNRLRYSPKVSKLRQVIRKLRGLEYATQHELCKELDEKDEEFIDALQETGPTYELQRRVEGLTEKTTKVEEDLRGVRDEVGRVVGRMQEVENDVKEIKSLLEQLVNSKQESSD